MKQELTQIVGHEPKTPTLWEGASAPATLESALVYREMDPVHVQVIDPLDQLSANMEKLEDMQARLRYMMREIRAMMKA
mgnify:CR=1 FL=1